MLLCEARQTRDNFTDSECPRQGHPQRAAEAINSSRGIFGIIKIAEDLPGPFEKHATGVGQRYVPRVAQEQLYAEPRFRGLRPSAISTAGTH